MKQTHNHILSILSIYFCMLAVTTTPAQDNFYFDPAPLDQNVKEGTGALLRCDVSNRKHIAFYWTFNNKPLLNTSRRFQEDSDLRITHVDKNKDSGSYRCIATNVTTGVSLRSTQASLNISWLTKTVEVQLKHPKSESNVVKGVYVILKCSAAGNPPPTTEWYRNKVRLFTTDNIQFQHNRNRLRLNNASADDNGVYSCRARNSAGDVPSSSNYLLNLQQEDAAYLDMESFTQKILVEKSHNALLHCKFRNSIITEWYFHEAKVTNQTGISSIYNNGTLIVYNVQADDVGTYKCVGISQAGPVQTFTSDLYLAYLDDLTEDSFEPKVFPNQPKVVPVGKNVHIKCIQPAGMPTPTVRWLDPYDREIRDTPSDHIHVAEERTLLNITNAQPVDSGNYSCVATNIAGTKKSLVWLIVSVPPGITRPPLSMRTEEGTDATFSCQMRGTPYPVTSILWTKNTKPVDMTHPRFSVDLALGTLRVSNVHTTDEGNYACVVNTTGHPVITSTNAHLYVTRRLKFLPPPVNRKLELDSEANVYCKAEGETEPVIRWKKLNGEAFPPHVKDRGGILRFDGVQHTDIGWYSCIASNGQGTINATIHINVVVKPQFKIKPQNTTAYEGYPVMIHCVAIGDPIPAIQWDRNNKLSAFDQSRFTVLANGTLQISEVYMEDMGRYGCTAGNSGGFQREEIYLHITGAGNYRRTKKDDDESFSMMKTVIIAVCSAVAYLAVVIGLTVYCSIRLVRAKNMNKAVLAPNTTPVIVNGAVNYENGGIPNEQTELMRAHERDSSVIKSDDAHSHASGVSSHCTHSSYSHHSNNRLKNYDQLGFPRHDLQTLGMLGKGQFGDVFLAKAHGIKDTESETLVVVKSLLSRDEQHIGNFCREIEMFHKLDHVHVVKLLGVCRDMEPQFLITEYCEWGDLKQFLWATRKDNLKSNVKLQPLTVAQKINMCNQVALGMEHLSNLQVVHRDLAARNILLNPTLDIKIANLALCKDVYAVEYFPFHQKLIPLRWMPAETVHREEYSPKSDVWAFGVFCWEVFALGDMPYTLKTDEEVLKGLSNGNCSLDLFSIMPKSMQRLVEECMQEYVQNRPCFSEVVKSIGDIIVDTNV